GTVLLAFVFLFVLGFGVAIVVLVRAGRAPLVTRFGTASCQYCQHRNARGEQHNGPHSGSKYHARSFAVARFVAGRGTRADNEGGAGTASQVDSRSRLMTAWASPRCLRDVHRRIDIGSPSVAKRMKNFCDGAPRRCDADAVAPPGR